MQRAAAVRVRGCAAGVCNHVLRGLGILEGAKSPTVKTTADDS